MCDLTPDQFATFPASRFSPRYARAFVREHSCPEHGSPVLGALLVVSSELVTNAVLYGAPPITVQLRCLGTEIQIAVGDLGSALPQEQGADEGSVLGMLIVDHVAHAWGTTTLPAGKEVWCRFLTGAVPRFGWWSSESRTDGRD